MSAPVRRPIVLKTIYRSGVPDTPIIKVLTYKPEAKGEEYLAEMELCSDLNLKDVFVHRVVCYSGEGTHVPLINTRLLMNVKTLKTLMVSTVNPFPRFVDYKNPCESRTGDVGRLSVCEIALQTPSNASREDPEIKQEILNCIFQDNEIEKLSRRPKREPLASSSTTDVVAINTTYTTGRTSDIPTRIRYNNQTDRKNLPYASSDVISPTRLPTHNAKMNSKDRIKTLMRQCVSICLQNNLAYDSILLEGESDERVIKLYIKKVEDYLNSKYEEDEHPNLELGQLAQLGVLVINLRGEITTFIPSSARMRGIMLIEDELGLVMSADAST